MSNMPLMPEDLETRTVMTPRTGTKICILIGLAFIVAAVYFYFVPVTGVRASSGSVFGCGTAAHPADSTFAKGTCWRVTDVEKYRAFACLAIGVLTLVLGAVMFGVDRRTETRRSRHTDGYADDRPRTGDEDRRGRDEESRGAHESWGTREDDQRGRREDDDVDPRGWHADGPRGLRRDGGNSPADPDHYSSNGEDETRRDRRSRGRRDWDDDRG